MPELPEVETVRRGLTRLLPDKHIKDVSWNWAKSFPNTQADVDNYIIGSKIIDVKRRAKLLMIELSSNYTLLIHLKMTGQLVYVRKRKLNVESKKSKVQTTNYQLPITADEVRFGGGHPNDSLINELPDKSTRVVFYLENKITSGLEASARKKRSAEQTVEELQSESTGAFDTAMDQERWRSFGLRPKAGHSGPKLFFNDQRKFGWVKLVPTAEVPNIDFMKKVGPEPLASDFTPTLFRQRLERRKNSNIKAVLLDQTVIAGIGNIYADEALWGAKIHPSTQVKDVSTAKLNKLFEELQFVLRLSIEKGGSTDKNYVDAEGKKGSYLSFARVFRREGQPCPRCRTTIIKLKVAGRGTHICPKCQKAVT